MAIVPGAVANEACGAGVDQVTTGLPLFSAVDALIPNTVSKSTVGAGMLKMQAWCQCGWTSGEQNGQWQCQLCWCCYNQVSVEGT